MVALSIGRDTFTVSHSDCMVSRRRGGGHTSYRPLLNMQACKKEQRGIFRFLAVEGVEGHEMHRRMCAVSTVCVVKVLWNGAKDSLEDLDRLLLSSHRK
ncbi:hypothetical protein TNCV_532141 [Trichonephila clavipes]|nr:hypothetical protein TNCV_532141 [Trichonephila clavipes]